MKYESGALTDLKIALKSETGLVIISGPTGSGKTTALNAAICELDRAKLNIITLEDPIEYTIPGITQVQISKKVSFSDALRAVLRQDPDVILVGEIRDEETASLCLKASATGHLVLSTVHANGAVEVVNRLFGLKVDLDTLRANLKFSAAQRLIQVLCPECKIPLGENEGKDIFDRFGANEHSGNEIRQIHLVKEPVFSSVYRRNYQGCSSCQYGLSGRKPILEYLTSDDINKYMERLLGSETIPFEESQCRRSLKNIIYEMTKQGEVDAYELLNA
jgi:type II secretory ATPase GspE/PulE/Tfp pilus assembly ATPase PilB-like protein